MALKGTDLVAEASTNNTDFFQIGSLNDATISFSGDNLDITSFGASFISRIQGLKDNSFSLSGFYDPADSNGQVAIRTALINDSDLWIQFKSDGTNGFKQKVKVATYELSAAVDGMNEISMEFEGDGSISLV